MITCCNLISGGIATLYAFLGDPQVALIWIVIGAVFDFFDGMSARALGVSSPIGKELDSLADDITFGLAPSAIIFFELMMLDYPAVLSPVSEYIPFAAFLVAAFSALRLAKFNLDERQSLGFIGLPTPANALFWGSLVVGYHQYIEDMTCGFALILVLILLSCYLLVAEIPMFALKFKHWGLNEDDNIVKYGFIAFSAAAVVTSAVGGMAVASIAVIILAYILVSIIMWCTKKH